MSFLIDAFRRHQYVACMFIALVVAAAFHAGCSGSSTVAPGAEDEAALAGEGAAGTDGAAVTEAGPPEGTLSLVRPDGVELAMDSKPLPLMLSVRATFATPMDAASVEGALSFTDPIGNAVDVTRSWNAEETALTLKPAKALMPGSTYTVELTADAVSKQGQPATAAAEVFTTMRRIGTTSDFNGDGVGDFAVGAPGQNGSGAVYVYSGKDPSAPLAVINYPVFNMNVKFGASVAIVDDVNGDGAAELLIGCPWFDNDSNDPNHNEDGTVFFFSGKKLDGGANISHMDAIITASSEIVMGLTVADAGDINGDGIHDVMMNTAPGTDIVYFFDGSKLIDADPNTPSVFKESDAMAAIKGDTNSYFGFSMTSIGDLDLDGRDDVLIGAPSAGTGHAYIFSGASITHNTNLGDAFASIEADPGDQPFGYAVASAGDFDADGYPDVLVGDWAKDNALGAAYVFAGKDLVQRGIFGIDRATSKISGSAADQRLGTSLSGIGDANLDGFDDLAIGSGEDMLSSIPTGMVQLFAGPDAAAIADDITPFNNATYGLVLAPLGDIDGKGKPDFLIGDLTSGLLKGGVFIYFTEDLKAPKLLSPGNLTPDAHFGNTIAGTRSARSVMPF